MTRHHQLKNEARRAEQRSDWARAIELYKSAIRLEEERGSGSDVGVYNRIGDLYLRQGDTGSAVEYYEQAADRYASHGLHTSAIALCNKILRIAPDRDEVYGRLARLHASTGLLAEARSAFLRFADRMRESDRLSEALEAVQDLVSLTGDEELRTAFAEQLVGAGLGAQAVAQLRLVYQARVTRGRNAQDIRERILALDPDADPLGMASAPPPRATTTAEPLVSDRDVDDLADLAGVQAKAPASPVPPPSQDPPTVDLPLSAPAEASATGAELKDAPVGGDPTVEAVLTRFRSQVREIVEETDHAVHYDLGVAYMGMGLFEEAIGEFRLAMQSPALMESAHALLGECIRARGESEVSESSESVPEAEEPVLPLATADDFMLGQSIDLGVPGPAGGAVSSGSQDAGAAPPPRSAVSEPKPEPVSATESDGTSPEGSEETADAAHSSADEEELADMLFQARLAQHRARAASEAGRADHEAHLDLGRTYERMGLATEAVRDLLAAVEGPPPVKAEALDALARAASAEEIEATALRDALRCLMDHERGEEAIELGTEYVRRPGIPEVDRLIIRELLPATEPPAEGRTEPAAPLHPAKQALAQLGDIFAELDEVVPADGESHGAESAGQPGTDVRPSPVSGADRPAASSADDPDSLFGEAEGLRAAGRMDEAESHYYKALELYEKKRDAINAIRAVDRLLGLRPDDVVLHHQKNEFAIMTNDRELLVSSYLDLAACLRRQNGFRSARTVYGRILDLDPGNAEARAGIAAVEADELARERRRQERRPAPTAPPAESLEPAGRAVEHLPGEIDAMFGDLGADAEVVAEATPDYESHFELGIAFRQMEMWDEAAREFKLAAQGLKNPLPAYENLGACLLELRRYDEARRTLEVAVAQPGPDAEKAGVLYQLGVAHLRSGDSAAARSCLERAVRLNPSRADAAALLSTLPA
jgi:tetratricopeptide (TPR) repeat protein